MDRAMYLTAMRDQNPKEFQRLSKSGEAEQLAVLKTREASRLFHALTSGMPRDSHGNLPLNVEREMQERVSAQMLEFPPETSEDRDQLNALAGDQPMVSPGKTL